MYPVTLCLERARCLVVGGGEVALRKVEGLLRERAAVTVVAPDAVAELHRLAAEKQIAWERRPYASGDPGGYRLVLAATDRRDVNRQVRDDAEAAGIWVNVADDPELCTFHLPARVERGPLQIAVSSGGKAPFTVRRLRERFERWLDPAWGAWAEAAARFRELARGRNLGAAERESRFDRFFDETVAADRLEVRVPGETEMSEWLDGKRTAETPPEGLVSLVGAGPGNGGLLTLRAYRRLRAADAVVYDRLAEPALPCDLPRQVELHAVGKEAGHHPVPQDEINALLVRLARQGKRVVRFKGGDPYVFGRGGEEALALFAAGIPFEVIPGVSTGVAGPAFAGIPVTQRGVSSQVTFFTANRTTAGAGSPAGPLLAPPARQTLVGFMGMQTLPEVTPRAHRKRRARDHSGDAHREGDDGTAAVRPRHRRFAGRHGGARDRAAAGAAGRWRGGALCRPARVAPAAAAGGGAGCAGGAGRGPRRGAGTRRCGGARGAASGDAVGADRARGAAARRACRAQRS